MITIKQLLKPGALVRVKRTSILKEFGLRCFGGWHPSDSKAWPGEIAEVKLRLLIGRDWRQVELIAEFPRERKVTLAALYTDQSRQHFADNPEAPGVYWDVDTNILNSLTLMKVTK